MELAERIINHLGLLLSKQSQDQQQRSMNEVESMLDNEGLSPAAPRRQDGPWTWSRDLIEDNPSLQEPLNKLRQQRFNPEVCASPEDLMSWLLPSNDSLS